MRLTMDLIDRTVDYLHHLAERSVALRQEGDIRSAEILEEEGRLIAEAIHEFTTI